MGMKTFPVRIEPQKEGGYTVQCLELPVAISEGETVEETFENIKDAIQLVLRDIQEEAREKNSWVARR